MAPVSIQSKVTVALTLTFPPACACTWKVLAVLLDTTSATRRSRDVMPSATA